MKILKFFTNLKNWQVFVLLAIFGLIAYANVINGEFIWDEGPLIVTNEYVHSFKHFFKWFTTNSLEGAGYDNMNLYRPLDTMVTAVIYSLFKLNPIPYHLANIFIHIGNAFLVFILLQRLNFLRFGSLLAAIIFLLHPVQTESVSYIAGLPDVLSPFFILLGLILFLGKNSGPLSTKTQIKIIACGILAILAKETGIILLPLMALVGFFKWKDYSDEAKISRYKALTWITAITLVYVILRSTVLNFTGSLDLTFASNVYTENFVLRVYTFFAVIVDYTIMTLYPAKLYFEKAFEVFGYVNPKVFLGVLIVLSGLALAITSFYKKKHFFITYLWFFISIGLVSGVFIPSNATYKEHWMYMPLIGIVLLIPSFWETLKSKISKQAFLAAFLIIMILFTGRTILRNEEWKDKKTFFLNELEHNQTSPRVYKQLGKYHFDRSEFETALEYFEKGVEADADKLLPELRFHVANTHLSMRNLSAAVNEYFTILQDHPNHFETHVAMYNIGIATHNKMIEEQFLSFIKRLEAGDTIDFATEIAPLGMK